MDSSQTDHNARDSSSSKHGCSPREDSVMLWLQANFQNSSKRTECCIVRGLIRCVWPSVSDRQIGKCVRKAFPSSMRLRSNSTYYYDKIFLVEKQPSQLPSPIESAHKEELLETAKAATSTCTPERNQPAVDKSTELPKHLHLERESISFLNPEHILAKGLSSTVFLAKYEGIYVAAKQFKTTSSIDGVLKEVQLILRMAPHEFLPMLVGIVIDKKPYLILWKFYGTKRSKTSTNLSIAFQCLSEKKVPSSKWVPVIIKIAQGIDYLHKQGYLHGKIENSHIVIHKADDNSLNLKLVGLGNCQEFNVNDSDAQEHISREIFYLGCVIGDIYKMLSIRHPSTSYILGRSFNDNLQKRPSASEIAAKFQYILESGHFES